MIRKVEKKDTKEILDIYSYYIIHTPITFEIAVPSLEEFQKRIDEIVPSYPYLVYTEGSKVLGYAYAHRSMEKEAYRYNAEITIYVHHEYTHRHIGSRLMEALLDEIKKIRLVNLYSLITVPNPQSFSLHEKYGFRQIGLLAKSGYKFHKWHDVAWLHLLVNEPLEPYDTKNSEA